MTAIDNASGRSARRICIVVFGILSFACAFVLPAQSQQQPGDRCRSYETAVESKFESVSVIPDRLLTDRKAALTCLAGIISKLTPSGATDQFDADVLNRFMSATSALRAFILEANAKDKAGNSKNSIIELIRDFRDVDSIELTQALSFGLRQQSSEARSNALLVLGNVIDNTTLCVPIDHIYDSQLNVRGRANLLAVISVVAPWAYAEHFDNICRMTQRIESIVEQDSSATQTKAILDNVRARLGSQTNTTNQSVWLPAGAKTCYDYQPRWGKQFLSYSQKRTFKLKCVPV